MNTIEFTDDELNLIHQDQINVFENYHIGDYIEHVLKDCPSDHFDGLEPFEISERQSILKKILDVANACDGYSG